MRVLRFFAHILFGLVFLVSGWLKILDPMGTGLIVSAYFNAAHLGFLSVISIPVGVGLSVLELLLGISVLTGIQLRRMASVVFILMLFFTGLSLVLYIFDPIPDCGCFGEAFTLANAQTFWKNVVLLLAAFVIFLHRKRYRILAPAVAEWSFLGFYLLLALTVSIAALIWTSWVDYGVFRPGTSVLERMEAARQHQPTYQTVFVYEKDGQQQEFALDQLPDSTWTFVDSQTRQLGTARPLFDFPLTDRWGNYQAKALLSENDVLFTAVLYRPQSKGVGYWEKLAALRKDVLQKGGDLYVLLAGTQQQAEELSIRYGIPSDHFLFSDYKTLISLSRSNGGIVYWHEAVVVKKWSDQRIATLWMNLQELLEEDAEIIAASGGITQQLICEGIILITFLSLVLMRYICGILYDDRRRYKYLRRLATRRIGN